MKHTPGPWTFEPGDLGDPSVGIDPQPPTVFVWNPNPHYDGIMIATLHDPISNNAEDGYPEYFGDANANARLISAVTDLLEACEEFVRKVECGEARSRRSYAQMKAAIAKAKEGS